LREWAGAAKRAGSRYVKWIGMTFIAGNTTQRVIATALHACHISSNKRWVGRNALSSMWVGP